MQTTGHISLSLSLSLSLSHLEEQWEFFVSLAKLDEARSGSGPTSCGVASSEEHDVTILVPNVMHRLSPHIGFSRDWLVMQSATPLQSLSMQTSLRNCHGAPLHPPIALVVLRLVMVAGGMHRK
jgi:hypothetical protein